MSITLDIVPKPGPTPLGNNTPAARTFASDYYKMADGQLQFRQRKTIWIEGLIFSLAAAGGNNYKGAAGFSNLFRDASVYSNAISHIDLVTALAALGWTAGKVADASLSSDVPTILQLCPRALQLSEEELDRIIIFLRAQLQT